MITTNIMNDFSEVVPYNNPAVPVYAQRNFLSDYAERKSLCHWHDDVEFIGILHGSMKQYVNGRTYTLTKGDILIISSRQFHQGYANGDDNCEFFCILINPAVFKHNTAVFTDFVEPVINNASFDKIILPADDIHTNKIFTYMQELVNLSPKKNKHTLLQYFGTVYFLWQEYFNLLKDDLDTNKIDADMEINTAKNMVSFIYENYQENISLTQIAASAGVCRNKCCQLFRKYIKQTPIDFLNSYRLEKSKYLLQNSSYTITQIAFQCGFNSVSYYIELFRRSNKCTPRQYRTNHQTK